MPQSWYSIRCNADSAEISIYEEIGYFGVTAKSFLDELKAIGPRPITLRLNSPGGSIFEGLAIYNRLREHAAGVTVKIDGIAASMASVIAMAGSRIEMAENALLMIHNPSGMVMGESEDMRELADLLDKLKASLLTSYERKTGMDRAKLAKMMDEETWLDATEAQSLGFIDAITEPLKLAARFDTARLPNAQAYLARKNLMETPSATLPDLSLETLQADLDATRANALTIIAERDALAAQFTELTSVANAAKAELAIAQSTIGELTAKASALETTVAKQAVNQSRLEALCGVKAIDPSAAITPEASPTAVTTDAALYDKFLASTGPERLAMLNNEATGPRLRAESRRRHAASV